MSLSQVDGPRRFQQSGRESRFALVRPKGRCGGGSGELVAVSGAGMNWLIAFRGHAQFLLDLAAQGIDGVLAVIDAALGELPGVADPDPFRHQNSTLGILENGGDVRTIRRHGDREAPGVAAST